MSKNLQDTPLGHPALCSIRVGREGDCQGSFLFCQGFEKRGFKGAMSIDQFCVELEMAKHQAIHGGGNWRLGRTWPGEWNQMIMKALRDAEEEVGRMLTRSEVLNMVAQRMKSYDIPMNFSVWRGR
jgi:hypothetical protein